MIHSDWHIHSEHSYDSSYSIESVIRDCKDRGFRRFGITDHVNYNEPLYLDAMKSSAEAVKRAQLLHPELVLGVELTPINKPEYDYLKLHGSREGFVAPISDKPLDMALAVTKEEMLSLGIQYAIGASHWRVDVVDRGTPGDMDTFIRDWYRQQLFLATDERVTVLGHPWYHGRGLWYEDFSVIPRSMNEEIGAALLENGKYVECNTDVVCSPKATEKYRYQYAEFLREYFERGIPVTIGSDSHNSYRDPAEEIEKYLRAAGFVDGDFSEIDESKLW